MICEKCKSKDTRTLAQNRSLHKFCNDIAYELNGIGINFKLSFIVKNSNLEIPYSIEIVKNHIWRPIQIAMYNKYSTRELNKKELSKVAKEVLRTLFDSFTISVDFPSFEKMNLKNDI